MTETDIYIKISKKSPRAGKGSYLVVLEAITASGKPGTLTIKDSFEDITPHRLELRAIVDALHRYKIHSRVNIHSEHGWFKAVRDNGWFDKWQQAGWMVNGHMAAGAELYQEIYMMETVCGMEIGTIDKDLGSYKTWLDCQMENAGPIQQNAHLGELEHVKSP